MPDTARTTYTHACLLLHILKRIDIKCKLNMKSEGNKNLKTPHFYLARFVCVYVFIHTYIHTNNQLCVLQLQN